MENISVYSQTARIRVARSRLANIRSRTVPKYRARGQTSMVRLNLTRLRWITRRLRAGRAQDLRDRATRTWELVPTSREKVMPAIHPDGMLDRVTGLSPWRDWEAERPLIEGGIVEHVATQAHLIEDVDIDGGLLYCGGAKEQPGFGREPLITKSHFQRMDEAHLMSNWTASLYFGHFLWDTFPLELMPKPGAPTVALNTKPYHHAPGYRALLDCPEPPLVTHGHVGRMTLYTDFSQNSFKAERYRTLRRRLRERLGENDAASGPGVYIRRGATGERRILTNETEIEHRLENLGFDIVDPTKLEADEIARRTCDAPIVVSVEGSQISHALYTIADGGTLLVLQPPDRFAMPYKEFTDCMEMRFAFLVGHPAAHGFTIDEDELQQLLDRLT